MTGLESQYNKVCIAAIEAAMLGSIVGDSLGCRNARIDGVTGPHRHLHDN